MSFTFNTPFVGACNMPVPPQYAGMSALQLQAFLTQLQTNYQAIIGGTRPVTIQYSAGEGNRSVTYGRTDAATVRGEMQLLAQLLNLAPRRAPLRPVMDWRG